MSLPPPQKKRKMQSTLCIICNDHLHVEAARDNIVLNPTDKGIHSLLTASEKRKDTVYDTIFPIREGILSGEIKIVFHKSCRATYTSKHNLNFVKNKSPEPSTSKGSDMAENSRILSQADTSAFDIKRDCFVCDKPNKRG